MLCILYHIKKIEKSGSTLKNLYLFNREVHIICLFLKTKLFFLIDLNEVSLS